jgi:hypothetical protein
MDAAVKSYIAAKNKKPGAVFLGLIHRSTGRRRCSAFARTQGP